MSLRLPDLVRILGAVRQVSAEHCSQAWLFTAMDGRILRLESNHRDTPDAFVWVDGSRPAWYYDCLLDCDDILTAYGSSQAADKLRPLRQKWLRREREEAYGPVRAVGLP
jgi:hypothetical protein